MARIYVWLRYSSSRQLTWQRNYNTQPRILGEAQKRLTDTIAKVCLHSCVTFAKKQHRSDVLRSQACLA